MKQGKLIAVASGKGGVGKTWFSITLAQALAKTGKKVMLFDGDLGLANIDVQLGLMAEHDINDVIEGHLPLSSAITRSEDGGFDVVAGRSGTGTLATMPAQTLSDLLEKIKAILPQYDAIIIDLGAGIDRTVRTITSAADIALGVTTDEPTALTDVYALIKLERAAGFGDNFRVVINMAADVKEGEATYEILRKSCEKFLKFTPQLAGIVRHDKRVKEAIRAQTPFLTRSPNTETATDVEKIAASLL